MQGLVLDKFPRGVLLNGFNKNADVLLRLPLNAGSIRFEQASQVLMAIEAFSIAVTVNKNAHRVVGIVLKRYYLH